MISLTASNDECDAAQQQIINDIIGIKYPPFTLKEFARLTSDARLLMTGKAKMHRIYIINRASDVEIASKINVPESARAVHAALKNIIEFTGDAFFPRSFINHSGNKFCSAIA